MLLVNIDAWFRKGSSCLKRKLSSDEEPSTSDSKTNGTVNTTGSSSSVQAKKAKTYFRKYRLDFLKCDFVCHKTLMISYKKN